MTTKSPFTRPGNTLFVVIFLLFALFLLSQIGGQTRFSPRGQLFAQPRFWPAVGVIGMVGFGAAHLLMNWRQHQSGWATEAFAWLRSLEYLIWFMIYVALVPSIGYLLATMMFTTLLALRAG